MLFRFMDFEATDLTAQYPEIKPGIGGVWFARWDQFNPNQGEYNGKLIRDWLASEAKNKLQNGRPKPLICFLLTHTAPDGTNAKGMDYTPGWLKSACPSVEVSAGDGTTSIMPAYGNAFWWQCLADAVKAFAAEIDGQEQVAYVDIGHGCDGELWTMKAPWNAGVKSAVERMFALKTVELLDVYKASFLQTPLLVRATPGSGRKTFISEAIKRGIGYHFCGMQPGAQNAHGWGNEYGTWDGLRDAHAAGCPAIAETTFGMGTSSAAYWSIMGMLAMKVDAMDVHPEWLDKVGPEAWNFVIAHMGKMAGTAPSAWCVLRDYASKWKPIQWTASNGVVSGQSDWPGNFEYYMSMDAEDSDTDVVEDIGPADMPEHRQCRRVRQAYFAIDPAFAKPPYEVAVRWYNQAGVALMVAHENRKGVYIEQPLPGAEAEGWITDAVTVDSRTLGLISDAGAYVHMVYAQPTGEPEQPPEPEPQPPTDWEGMLAKVDAAMKEASQAREQAAYAGATAHNIVSDATEAEREAVSAEKAAAATVESLVELRAMVQAAQGTG